MTAEESQQWEDEQLVTHIKYFTGKWTPKARRAYKRLKALKAAGEEISPAIINSGTELENREYKEKKCPTKKV
jgi:hypothetical protein